MGEGEGGTNLWKQREPGKVGSGPWRGQGKGMTGLLTAVSKCMPAEPSKLETRCGSRRCSSTHVALLHSGRPGPVCRCLGLGRETHGEPKTTLK